MAVKNNTTKGQDMDNTNRHFEIGETVYFRGDKATVTSAAFMYLGHEYQNATMSEGHRIGNEIQVPTPRQHAANVSARQEEYRSQQEQFERLHK